MTKKPEIVESNIIDREIVTVLEHSGLERSQAQEVMEGFKIFFEEVKSFENKAKAILITDATQVAEMKEARTIRLELKNIRVNAEKVRKERKEFFLRGGKAIDGLANVLKALIVPLEEHLDKQENYPERMEGERKDKVNQERILALQPFVQDILVYNLRDMTDGAFEVLLKTSQAAFQAQKDAERVAEEERKASEEAKRLEDERVREENAKLKVDAEAREKAHAEEREKAEAERKSIEEARQKEAEAREKAEAELRKKNEAEERAKQEKVEADRKEVAEKDKREKAEKYRTFRAANGWTEETKADFYEQTNDTGVVLYKKVGVFKLR